VKAERGAPRFWQACRWAAVFIVGAAYSVLAYRAAASATRDSFSTLVAVTPLLALAFAMAWRSRHRAAMLASWVAACAALYAIGGWLLTHYQWIFLLEHAGMHALLGVAFGKSLRAGHEPLVTGFARIVHRTLSPALVAYTRSVTLAWTLYFAGISLASLLLFRLAPIAVWSTFANLLTFPLLVAMFAAEYAVRCHVLPVADRAGPLEAIRAYRQSTSRPSASGGRAHQP
jgi:uncharacterized membrane protein